MAELPSPAGIPGNTAGKGFPEKLLKFGLVFQCWLEEPIGVLVPLFATLTFYLVPQMADLFVGMEYSILRCPPNFVFQGSMAIIET